MTSKKVKPEVEEVEVIELDFDTVESETNEEVLDYTDMEEETYIEEEEVEVIEEKIVGETIDELEESFGDFLDEMERCSDEAVEHCKMGDLDEMTKEIADAQTFISSFMDESSKSFGERVGGFLTALPIVGEAIQNKMDEAKMEKFKSEGVKDVLNEMFNNFEKKKEKIKMLTKKTEIMRNNLREQELQLGMYIKKLQVIKNAEDTTAYDKIRATDMENRALVQESITKEMIYNQIDFIIELNMTLMNKLGRTLPIIKNTMKNNLGIASNIAEMKKTLDMMNGLEQLSNKITRTSTGNIQTLIVDTTKSITSGTDIEFYKESSKRNIEFSEKLKNERVANIKKMISDNEVLNSISFDSTHLIEDRKNAEIMALEDMTAKIKNNNEKVKKTELKKKMKAVMK